MNKNPHIEMTGYGFATPLGNDIDQFDENLFALKSGIGVQHVALQGLDAFDCAVAKTHLDVSQIQTPSKLPADRSTALALYSVQKALAAAGVDLEKIDPERMGVFWGSGMSGAANFDLTSELIYAQKRRLRPTSVITSMPSTPASEIALMLQAQGACITFANACASSSLAIGAGLNALRQEELDWVIVGGSESMLTPGVLSAWHALRVMAPVKDMHIANCIPFSQGREGFAMGEGAAAFVLQRSQTDQPNKKHFQISGFATNCDGQHMTKPNPNSQMRVMQKALQDAQLQIKDIDYINAHGTATVQGDQSEAQAITQVFGTKAVAVSSTKPLHGHLLGASGAIEMLVCLRALAHDLIPANARQMQTEENMDLDLVIGPARSKKNMRHVLSNSFAFGGTNATLIVSKHHTP